MAMVNDAIGDRHCGYRREGGKPGDHERIGPVDTGRGSGCLDDDRATSRPDAEWAGTIIRANHDGRGSDRPDAEWAGTIIRTPGPQCG